MYNTRQMSHVMCDIYTIESCDILYMYNTTVMQAAEEDDEEACSKGLCDMIYIQYTTNESSDM